MRCNTKLRDKNVHVPAHDERATEVLASGLPLHHGAQLAMWTLLRSALTAQGHACSNASQMNGAVLTRAREDKEVVVALETGGRWSSEATEFVSSLAGSRSSAVAWIRFPLLAKKVDQDVVSVLREGIRDLVGLFQGGDF